MHTPQTPHALQQRGGTLLGLIIGIVVGLGAALVVAMYVMKVPSPFNNRNTVRTSTQDAEEAKKNKDWNPNAALAIKPKNVPPVPENTAATDEAANNNAAGKEPLSPHTEPAPTTPAKAAQPAPSTAPAAVAPAQLDARASKSTNATSANAPASTSAEPAAAPARYYVQAGSFKTKEDAKTLHARLALSNFESTIIEREKAGKTIYRVRLGPFPTLAASQKTLSALEAAGFDALLVRPAQTPVTLPQ